MFPASRQILATYHGDHAYCFDVTGAASAYTNVFLRHAPSTDTPAQGMERWKFNGNAAMFERDYYSAVW